MFFWFRNYGQGVQIRVISSFLNKRLVVELRKKVNYYYYFNLIPKPRFP